MSHGGRRRSNAHGESGGYRTLVRRGSRSVEAIRLCATRVRFWRDRPSAFDVSWWACEIERSRRELGTSNTCPGTKRIAQRRSGGQGDACSGFGTWSGWARSMLHGGGARSNAHDEDREYRTGVHYPDADADADADAERSGAETHSREPRASYPQRPARRPGRDGQ